MPPSTDDSSKGQGARVDGGMSSWPDGGVSQVQQCEPEKRKSVGRKHSGLNAVETENDRSVACWRAIPVGCLSSVRLIIYFMFFVHARSETAHKQRLARSHRIPCMIRALTGRKGRTSYVSNHSCKSLATHKRPTRQALPATAKQGGCAMRTAPFVPPVQSAEELPPCQICLQENSSFIDL